MRSVHARHTFLSICLAFGSRLLFAAERQTGRLARRCVPIPPWVEIAIRAFSSRRAVIGLGWFTSGLYVSLGRSRRRFPRQVSDGDPEEVQEATGKPPGGRTNLEQKLYPCAVTRNANAVRRNRVASRSCSSGIVTAHSQRYRGEYAGAARPRLRQRVFDSLDSLHLDRGVGALYAGKPCAFYAAIRADPSARPYRRS